MRAVLTTMPPQAATAPPLRPVPAPRATTGTRRRCAMRTTAWTCVALSGNTTASGSARSTDAPLVIPTYEGERGHPSFFQQSLFLELMDPTLGGGARTVVHRHLALAELVAVPDPGIRLDIDTPAEYEAMLAAGIDAP